MNWHLIIPANLGRERKTRLAPRLSADRREALSDAMLSNVLEAARQCGDISKISILSPVDPVLQGIDWIADKVRGLNEELTRAARNIDAALAVVHADLPFLTADDLTAFLKNAESAGVAIAPDSADAGTNGLAMTDPARFDPAFGPDSLSIHRSRYSDAAIVERHGLAFDVDMPDDLDRLIASGFAGLSPDR